MTEETREVERGGKKGEEIKCKKAETMKNNVNK